MALLRPRAFGGFPRCSFRRRISVLRPRPPMKLTVFESIYVARTPADVWDFTQDYSRRTDWDPSILEATVLEREPSPRVRVRAAGGLRAIFQYRQFDRPTRTSLVMEEVRAFLIEGGGGSWSYEPSGEGTLWTQSNTLIVNSGWWWRPLIPLVRYQLRASTKGSMGRAKALLEANEKAS